MYNTKFTKGKWFIDEKYTSIVDENKNPIYAWYGVGNSIYLKDEVESKANSLLISKAPEMLEMLKECKYMAGHLGFEFIEKKLEKLIKEATEL
jgi:hypothetical protein